jgi:hypothetical protein
MALAQIQFADFHKAIKLSYDDDAALRTKRETLLTDLKQNLSDDVPTWSSFNQGSYELKTGIWPPDGDYDIDVGLSFDCDPADYEDPVDLKIKVRDALNKGNRTVVIKRPCVTVIYMKDGKPDYHVDLAIYSHDAAGMHLAKGKENSADELRVWARSEPIELTEYIWEKHAGEEAKQFRRVVRYLKRWRDNKLNHGNFPSIALTVAAADWISPSFDPVSDKPRDLLATRDLVQSLLDGWVGNRLRIHLPVAPYTDLLEKLTDIQMSDLKVWLSALQVALQDAFDEPDLREACLLLQKQFGNDFPVPDKVDTTKKTQSAVISTGSSA